MERAKVPQAEAGYQVIGAPAQRCGKCAAFRRPNECGQVDGYVDSIGGCRLWYALRDKRHTDG